MKFKRLALILSPLIGTYVIGTYVIGTCVAGAFAVETLVGSPAAAASSRSAASNAATTKAPPPGQTIAMQSELNPAPTASTPDIRWLGYGLFLLQIGWIPLQFVKVQPIQLDE
jgi:hypothetical protein